MITVVGVPSTTVTKQFFPEFGVAASVLIVMEPFTPPPRKWERDKISTKCSVLGIACSLLYAFSHK